jgi:hypothetical protein
VELDVSAVVSIVAVVIENPLCKDNWVGGAELY